MRPTWPCALPGYLYSPYLATSMRPAWPPPHARPLLLATTTMCAHHPRVEISRIDRFRAYLKGGIRDRPFRDIPSRASIIELQKFNITGEVAGEVA